MDASTHDSLARTSLPNSPRTTFDQVKYLLKRSTDLKQEAAHLKHRVDTLNDQADVLHTVATFLQTIANGDENLIGQAFNRATKLFDHFRKHADIPDKFMQRLYDRLRVNVRGSQATLKNVENFIKYV